jgi:hypothetical protein
LTREFAAGCYATWWSDRAIGHCYFGSFVHCRGSFSGSIDAIKHWC